MTKQGKMWVWILVAVVVIVGGGYLLASSGSGTSNSTGYTAPEQNTQPNQTSGPRGRVVFSVTDAAMNMGNVSEVNVEVASVDVHSKENGWVNISTATRTYDLLLLNANNQSALLADSNVQPGTYDQIRLTINSVSVKLKDGTTKLAKLPSGEFKINTTFTVNADKTSNINFDFLADKSLHLTGNGTYIFAPVVKTKVKSDADVEIKEDNSVSVTGGHDDGENDEGMDIDGAFKSNFQINKDVKLRINSNDKIEIEN